MGRGPRGNSATCLALSQLSVTSSTTHKQIGPLWCWFPGGWVCARSWTLWVSPTNSPMRLGVSLAATSTPTGVFSQRFWGFISPCYNPGSWGLSRFPVVPPSLSVHKCGATWSSSCHLASSPLCLGCLSLPRLPISASPTGLDECFLFNSLVVRLLYSLIFWQFWLGFVFKFVVVLLLVVWGGEAYLPTPPSWLEVLPLPFLIPHNYLFFYCLCSFAFFKTFLKFFIVIQLQLCAFSPHPSTPPHPHPPNGLECAASGFSFFLSQLLNLYTWKLNLCHTYTPAGNDNGHYHCVM